MTISLYNQAQASCKSQRDCVVPFIGRRSIRPAAFGNPLLLNDPRNRLNYFFVIHSEEFMLICESCSATLSLPSYPAAPKIGLTKNAKGNKCMQQRGPINVYKQELP
jgi:hypothetical protein